MHTGRDSSACHRVWHCLCSGVGNRMVGLRKRLIGDMNSLGPEGHSFRIMVVGGLIVSHTQKVVQDYFFGGGEEAKGESSQMWW